MFKKISTLAIAAMISMPLLAAAKSAKNDKIQNPSTTSCALQSGSWQGHYRTVASNTGTVTATIHVDDNGNIKGSYSTNKEPAKALVGVCHGNDIAIDGGMNGRYENNAMSLNYKNLVAIQLVKA